EAQQTAPNERSAREVKRVACFFDDLLLQLRWRAAKVRFEKRERLRRRDALHGPSLDFVEGRPQCLVTRDNAIERAAERRRIERAGEAQPDRQVIRAADAVELPEEPKALLRER